RTSSTSFPSSSSACSRPIARSRPTAGARAMNLKAWGRIGGLFGLVVLFSAVFNWLFVTGSINSAGVIARLALGVAGVAFWLITNRSEKPLGRGAFYGTVSAASAAALVAALVGGNSTVVRKPKRWDQTKDA